MTDIIETTAITATTVTGGTTTMTTMATPWPPALGFILGAAIADSQPHR
jgi:hypothetical protein